MKRIEVTHPQCLTFYLHRPDYWLAHRLASYCSHLAHPQFPLIGTGPFRLTQFTAELVRLESHIQQLRNFFDTEEESVGKKIDFLIQEMNREANTIGSKSNDKEITSWMLDI